jgi:hypothetical protein
VEEWYGVHAANDSRPIESASFSVNYFKGGSGPGQYLVYANQNNYIACSAPNYQTAYVYHGPGGGIIFLNYIGGWPQTY